MEELITKKRKPYISRKNLTEAEIKLIRKRQNRDYYLSRKAAKLNSSQNEPLKEMKLCDPVNIE